MTWLWKNGVPRLATNHQSPGHFFLTSGYKTLREAIPCIEPGSGFRTLWVHLSPSGSQSHQEKVLWQHAECFQSMVNGSAFTPVEVYCCYMQYICPSLTYPLPCTSLTQQQCRRIQAPTVAAILPKLHMNRHTPRAVLFASP